MDSESTALNRNNKKEASKPNDRKLCKFTSGSQRKAAVPGKPRGATYDGNLCLICSDRASGFHYGVLACEGCKGFFKRFCKEKSKSNENSTDDTTAQNQNRRQCVYGGNCDINIHTRNRCQYCRMQKCIELGMSKDGIKLGRRSKKFKQNLNSKINNISSNDNSSDSSSNTSQNIIKILKQQDNKLILKAIDLLSAAAATSNLDQNNDNSISDLIVQQNNIYNNQNKPFNNNIVLSKNLQGLASNNDKTNDYNVQQPTDAFNHNNEIYRPQKIRVYSMFDQSQISDIIRLITEAFNETRNDEFYAIGDNNNNVNEKSQEFFYYFEKGFSAILTETRLLDHLNNLIENTVLFAKNVPYFMNIHESDRILLLKESVFEIICVRHACYFANFSNELTFVIPFYNVLIKYEWICEKIPELAMFIKILFEFYTCFNIIQLNQSDLALFCSFLIFNLKNSDLTNSESLTNYRDLFSDILLNELQKNQTDKSIDRLNSLLNNDPNNNHLTNHQKLYHWLLTCCNMLKQLNIEHVKILNQYKETIQFPDLYSELYNLG